MKEQSNVITEFQIKQAIATALPHVGPSFDETSFREGLAFAMDWLNKKGLFAPLNRQVTNAQVFAQLPNDEDMRECAGLALFDLKLDKVSAATYREIFKAGWTGALELVKEKTFGLQAENAGDSMYNCDEDYYDDRKGSTGLNQEHE